MSYHDVPWILDPLDATYNCQLQVCSAKVANVTVQIYFFSVKYGQCYTPK